MVRRQVSISTNNSIMELWRDVPETAAAAKRNADRNELTVHWIEQDVFQFLRTAEKAQAQYDLIVLDPPSFTRTKIGLRNALRGYRELHMRAFGLLSKDGL